MIHEHMLVCHKQCNTNITVTVQLLPSQMKSDELADNTQPQAEKLRSS